MLFSWCYGMVWQPCILANTFLTLCFKDLSFGFNTIQKYMIIQIGLDWIGHKQSLRKKEIWKNSRCERTQQILNFVFFSVEGNNYFLLNYFRNNTTGTWLIQSLCEVFMEKCCDHELHELLSMVGQRMRMFKSPRGNKQSFSYEVIHFYKKLYFNPGLSLADMTD